MEVNTLTQPPGPHAHGHEPQGLTEHQRDDPKRRGADGQPHADLAPAERHEVGQDGIQSGGGEDQRHRDAEAHAGEDALAVFFGGASATFVVTFLNAASASERASFNVLGRLG